MNSHRKWLQEDSPGQYHPSRSWNAGRRIRFTCPHPEQTNVCFRFELFEHDDSAHMAVTGFFMDIDFKYFRFDGQNRYRARGESIMLLAESDIICGTRSGRIGRS